MNDLKAGNDSFELHSKILSKKQQINTNFLELGDLLVVMHDTKRFKAYCPTWNAYLAQPELSIEEKTAYELMKISKTFGNSAHAEEIIEIDRRKVARITQFANQDNIDEWIDKAKTLSYSDLGKEIREFKGEKVEEETRGRLIQCPRCGHEWYV